MKASQPSRNRRSRLFGILGTFRKSVWRKVVAVSVLASIVSLAVQCSPTFKSSIASPHRESAAFAIGSGGSAVVVELGETRSNEISAVEDLPTGNFRVEALRFGTLDKLNDAVLDHISHLGPSLKRLDLPGGDDFEKSLLVLSKVDGLDSLTFRNLELDNQRVDALAKQVSLQVRIIRVYVSPKSLSEPRSPTGNSFDDRLAAIPGVDKVAIYRGDGDLIVLILGGTEASSLTIERIKQYCQEGRGLWRVKLWYRPGGGGWLTDDSFDQLATLTQLTQLVVSHNEVPISAKSIRQLKTCRILTIVNSPVAQDAFAEIGRLKQLQKIRLTETGISDSDIASWSKKGLMSAAEVVIEDSNVTDQAVDSLKERLGIVASNFVVPPR